MVNDHTPLPPAYRPIGEWKWTKLRNIDRLRWLAPAPAVAGTTATGVEVCSATSRPGRPHRHLPHPVQRRRSVVIMGDKDAQIRTAGVAGFVRPIDPKAKRQISAGLFGTQL